MRLKFFCPRWGAEQLSWPDFLRKVKEAGYDGVEYAIGANVQVAELDAVWNACEVMGLSLIAQHYDTEDADFNLHYDKYAEWLEKMEPYPVVKINSQTGKDYFSLTQNKLLIALAIEYTGVTGSPVVHETHRGKFSFAAHLTCQYLRELHDLRLTLDVSHWVCVSESYLEHQLRAIELAISRTDHLHARVGYPEGPQVVDPFLPEWSAALEAHLGWWDSLVSLKKWQEAKELTVTPEYGPYPYAIEAPLTRKVLGDQWGINVRMMRFLRGRYE
ncbi:MAG: sugar phosphate isomerase/epimerase [Chitinophagaceae bacterium]|nr:MAG: sugar phosphate isomerase/epimerase [Chitinophagaceae bacterium]